MFVAYFLIFIISFNLGYSKYIDAKNRIIYYKFVSKNKYKK